MPSAVVPVIGPSTKQAPILSTRYSASIIAAYQGGEQGAQKQLPQCIHHHPL